MRAIISLCFAVGLGLGMISGVSSAATVDFTYQGGALWGHMEDAVIDGKHMFCAMNHGLMIYDITDPTSPDLVSTCAFPYGMGTCIAVSGNYAYVGVHWAGMMIFDISDVSSPQLVGQVPVVNRAVSICISGTTVSLCDEFHGLHIIDVSDPTAPSKVGFFAASGGSGGEVCVARENFVYMASCRNFWILDVTDPADPQQVGYYYGPDCCRDISVTDSLALLADDDSGLVILDIEDPAAPAELARFPVDTIRVHTVAVQENIAYVGIGAPADGYGVKLIDISDPSQPSLIDQLPADGYTAHTSQGQLFVTDHYSSYKLYDIADPAAPQLLSANSLPCYGYAGYGQRIASDGRYVYVAGGNMGLVIVDISDPAQPVVVRDHITPNRAYDVFVRDGYAYVADNGEYYSEGLKVVDIANPREAAVVGSYRASSCNKITVAGDYAFLGGNAPTNYILDISDPTIPVQVGITYIVGITRGLATQDKYLYMSYDWGIVTADISDASEPAIIDTLAMESNVGELLIYKGYLLAAVMNGFHVLDIASDPVSPNSVAFCTCRADDIKPYGNYLFVGNMQGVSIIDMTDPLDPTIIGTQVLDYGAGAVAPYYNGVAAYDPEGLSLFHVNMPACCTLPGDAAYDGTTNLADVIYLINYIFKGGPALLCPPSGDANGDCALNIGDAVYLVEYIFKGGDAPVCGDCP